MCSLRRRWCQWRTQGYSLNPSVLFNSRRLISSDDWGLAAGSCCLAKYQVRVNLRMLLLNMIPVLVGTAPNGATINTRTWIVLRSVMTINALRLCKSFPTDVAQVWAFKHFTHAGGLLRRPRRRLNALISHSPGWIGLLSCYSFHKA